MATIVSIARKKLRDLLHKTLGENVGVFDHKAVVNTRVYPSCVLVGVDSYIGYPALESWPGGISHWEIIFSLECHSNPDRAPITVDDILVALEKSHDLGDGYRIGDKAGMELETHFRISVVIHKVGLFEDRDYMVEV